MNRAPSAPKRSLPKCWKTIRRRRKPIWGKFQSTAKNWDKDGTWNFIDHDTICVSGTWDNRLNFSEVILEPNLQVKNNRIIVRVKTDDFDRFDTTIVRDANGNVTHHPGVLATEGTVDGEYTSFIYADTNATVNGKLYAVTAMPKDSGVVCVWEDGNTRKTYEGNTFYYTAGNDPKRNIITLSAARAASSVTLEGTLRYANYNLRTGYEGNESQVPAVGAVLSAGSAGGVADADGYVTAGRIPCSGLSNHYLRYLVSVNGADMVQEVLLPTASAGESIVPNVLYDFTGDEAENVNLGKRNSYGISYSGGRDGEGNDPCS